VRALRALLALVCVAPGLPAQEPPPRLAEPARLAAQSLLIALARAGDRLVAVGDRGIIVLSDDRGASWQQAQEVPVQALLTGVCFHDARHGVAVGHDEVILVTEDAGRTWKRTHYAPEAQGPLLDVWCGSGGATIAVGAYSAYLVSQDGGLHWQSVKFTPAAAPAASASSAGATDETALNGGYHLNRIAAGAGARLYIAGEAGHLYRSDDGGSNWRQLSSPYAGSFFDVLPLGGDVVLALGLRGHVYRSTDAGMSWQPARTLTDVMLDGGVRFGSHSVVLVGLSGVLLVSADDGVSFVPLRQADQPGFAAVIEAGAHQFVLAGDRGVRTVEISQTADPIR
jgi:photosystem II stability/assembly factor-like uncharacterized protein